MQVRSYYVSKISFIIFILFGFIPIHITLQNIEQPRVVICKLKLLNFGDIG